MIYLILQMSSTLMYLQDFNILLDHDRDTRGPLLSLDLVSVSVGYGWHEDILACSITSYVYFF